MTFKPYAKPAAWLTLLLCLFISTYASASPTTAYTAQYKIYYGLLKLGTISFTLTPKDDYCFVYQGKGNPNAIVSALVGDLAETSHFCLTKGNQVQTTDFKHNEKGSDKHSYQVKIDWQKKLADYKNKAGKHVKFEVSSPLADPLSIQMAARLWLANAGQPQDLADKKFALISKDKVKHYTLSAHDAGNIDVPAGLFDTVLVERIDHKDKHLRFWLAKYSDWLPVKVEHQKGSRIITMKLVKLKK